MTGGLPEFTARLSALFERVVDPHTRKPYANSTVAKELTDAGTPVSGGYIGQLRNGYKSDPSARVVGAIAEFFGVSVEYFFGPDEEAEETIAQLDQIVRLRNQGVRGILMRAQGISPEALEQVAGILDHIRKLEGLNVDGTRQDPPE